MRPDGFPTADIAVDILRDDRVIRAVRSVGSDAVAAYLAILTASWSRGERVDAGLALDALPRVYQLDPEAVLAALEEAGLLDAQGRIPEATWASWFDPAHDRKERIRAQRSVAGKGNRRLASVDEPSTGRQRTDNPSVRPSVVRSNERTERNAPAPVNGAGAAVPLTSSHARGSSWAGRPCVDPIDHAWTHVMTPAGMVCRSCDP